MNGQPINYSRMRSAVMWGVCMGMFLFIVTSTLLLLGIGLAAGYIDHNFQFTPPQVSP